MADIAVTEVPAGLAVNEQHMAFEMDAGVYARAAIGLIVLASDQTVEHEFRRIFDLPGVALYQSRIYNDTNITPETLKAMEAGMTAAGGPTPARWTGTTKPGRATAGTTPRHNTSCWPTCRSTAATARC